MADRPFVVDEVLTSISIGYRNPVGAYIADRVLPRTDVTAENFKWTEFPIEQGFNAPDARVARRGQVQQLEYSGIERSSAVEDFGYDVPIPNSDIQAAANARARGVSSYDPEGHAVTSVVDSLMNQRELRVANIVFNPANYAVGRRRQLSGASQFNDYGKVDGAYTSNPVTTILQGMDATLIKRPNKAVLGRKTWSAIRSHPAMVNAVKGNLTSEGLITIAQFADLLAGEGIQEVLVGDAYFNAAKPGQVSQMRRAWGSHLALLHIDPNANAEAGDITWGLTAQYGGRISGRIDDPDVGLQGGIRVRTGERIKELIVAQDVGYLIQEAVA